MPPGYFVFRSQTFGNVYFWRGFVDNGSTKTAVDNTRKFAKVYPLAQAKNPPAMKFVNVSGKEFNTIHANDFHFYEEVNHIVQEEPNEALNPETLGLLAAIGIEKGKTFAPDARMKKLLTEAVAVGNATARALTFRPRDKSAYFYPNSAWFTPMPGGSYEFLSQPGVRSLDARVMMHYYATGITPAMVQKMVGVGSQYAVATTDSEARRSTAARPTRFTCAQYSRETVLVVRALRQPDALHAPNRSAAPRHRQPEEGYRDQSGHVGGCVVWSHGAGWPRSELGADGSRQGVECLAAALQSAPAVVRQDMEAWRVRTGEVAPERMLERRFYRAGISIRSTRPLAQPTPSRPSVSNASRSRHVPSPGMTASCAPELESSTSTLPLTRPIPTNR